MSQAPIQQLTIEQGETWEPIFEWYANDSDYQAGTKVDLTGWTGRMKAKDKAGVVVIDLTTENGGITLDDTLNVQLSISATETALLTVGTYFYDIELVSSGDKVTKFMKGNISVLGEITT